MGQRVHITNLTLTATLMFAATGGGAELAEPVLVEDDPVLPMMVVSYSGSDSVLLLFSILASR